MNSKLLNFDGLKTNANIAFLIFACGGLVGSLLIKFLLSESDNSFYPTLVFFVALLFVFHRFSYVAITQGRFKDIGDGKRLTDASIVDGCYYLGFTFTLLILVTSFVSIGSEASSLRLKYDNNLQALMDILNRFCVGLFTTGYGLVARIHLSNLIEIEELDPEGLREKLNVKTAALINVIDAGTASLTNLIVSSNESIKSSISTTTDSITSQATILSENLSDISSVISKVSTKLKKQVENLDMTDASAAIEANLLKTSEEVNSLNKSIESVAKNFNGAGDVISDSSKQLNIVLHDLVGKNANLLNSIESLTQQYSNLSKESINSSANLSASTDSLRNLTDVLNNSKVVLTELNQRSSDVTVGVGSLEGKFSELSRQLAGVNSALIAFEKSISSKRF